MAVEATSEAVGVMPSTPGAEVPEATLAQAAHMVRLAKRSAYLLWRFGSYLQQDGRIGGPPARQPVLVGPRQRPARLPTRGNSTSSCVPAQPARRVAQRSAPGGGFSQLSSLVNQ